MTLLVKVQSRSGGSRRDTSGTAIDEAELSIAALSDGALRRGQAAPPAQPEIVSLQVSQVTAEAPGSPRASTASTSAIEPRNLGTVMSAGSPTRPSVKETVGMSPP